MQTTPTNLKGFLVTEDIRSGQRIQQNICIPIEDYEYTLKKSRQSNGVPYPNATSGSILTVTMSIGTRNSMKVFYERLQDASPANYSVVFDATFNERDQLGDYYSAFVLTGSVVGINEDYDRTPTEGYENLTITVQILINQLTVLGKTSNVTYK